MGEKLIDRLIDFTAMGGWQCTYLKMLHECIELTFALTLSLNEHFTGTTQRIIRHCNAIETVELVNTQLFNKTVNLYK